MHFTPSTVISRVVVLVGVLLYRYYDGQLVSDDDVSAVSGSSLRDVVLAPPPADAPPGSMPMSASAAAAAAGRGAGGSSGSGVLLSRAYGESQLYTQVCIAAVLCLCSEMQRISLLSLQPACSETAATSPLPCSRVGFYVR
jgi:hypothetical protein